MNNAITIVGHVGKDPITKTFGDTGNKLVKFSVAVKEYIVAAKTVSVVEDMNKHHVPITTESLAYAYNPDVFSYSNNQGGRDYKALYSAEIHASHAVHWDQRKEMYANKPEIITASKHIKNVMHQLDLLEPGH
jgi:single-stranded DNA-binding protein